MIARQTAGLAGADLANVCNEAAIFAARARRDVITQEDFDTALERVVAGMQSRRTLNDHERRVVAFHEAGHALCAELLPGVNRVHKISIVPRGNALGYTLNLPEEDRYLKTREELINHMIVLLGGRAAEEIVFGAVTTGASDDLKRVAEISRAMVHEYAMGTSITSRRSTPRAARSPTARASCATRSSSTSPTRRCARRRGSSASTATSSTRSPSRCCATRCSSATEIDRIMAGTPRIRRGGRRPARRRRRSPVRRPQTSE